ncbi:MAG: bifunctional UDP-sugar hydrolase/5'-nucleotidase [Gammaproteobacteria bacterium]
MTPHGFRRFATALTCVSSLAAGVLPMPVAAATRTVKVIALNDFHGNMESPGEFGIQPGGPGSEIAKRPAGGVEYLAAYVKRLRAGNPDSVVVSAGDLIGASPLVSAFFHDEGTIETMNRLGLDFNAVGNHEFDEGSAELLRMQKGGCHPTDVNTCKGERVGTPTPFEGAKFQFLAANVVSKATGRTIFPAYGIRKFGRTRVAFIGMTLKSTPDIVTPAGVAGLAFRDEADTINALVRKLRRRGVKAIVVLLHEGGYQGVSNIPAGTPPDNFMNDCKDALQNPTVSPIVGIVARMDDAVDLVISGHTHTGYNCRLPNRVGRGIPVTQAGAFGRALTDIDLTIDTRTGDVIHVTAHNLTVDRTDAEIAAEVTANPTIANIVAGYRNEVAPLAGQVIGTIAATVSSVTNAAGEIEAGNLIADAQLEATRPAHLGGAQIALMNPGGVRSPGLPCSRCGIGPPPVTHDVTYLEGFTLQPFGNSLVTMTLTAQQINDVLEQQFPGCNGQIRQNVLQVSNGFSFSWNDSAPPCEKIVDATLTAYDALGNPLVTDHIVAGGTVRNPERTYRVTVNSYLATGGDNLSVLTGGKQLVGGALDIDALVAYLAAFKAPNAPYDPASTLLHKPRVTRLP